jgi:hypothetical protein
MRPIAEPKVTPKFLDALEVLLSEFGTVDLGDRLDSRVTS